MVVVVAGGVCVCVAGEGGVGCWEMGNIFASENIFPIKCEKSR